MTVPLSIEEVNKKSSRTEVLLLFKWLGWEIHPFHSHFSRLSCLPPGRQVPTTSSGLLCFHPEHPLNYMAAIILEGGTAFITKSYSTLVLASTVPLNL